MSRTKLGIAIASSVVFLAVCFVAYSDEGETPTQEPARAVRTPVRPAPILEEETPQAKPVTRTTVRRPTTPSRIKGRLSTIGKVIKPAEDPYKDSVILVEAFMVEVQLSALHSQGVPEISEGCKSVSAEQIIKLMKTTDAAVVTAGAKVAVGQNSKAETKTSTRQSIVSGEPEKKQRVYVEVGTIFSTFATIRSGQKIYLDIGFEHSSIEEGDGKIDTGVFVEREWTSSVTLQEGKPTLVGAFQGKETGTFLIVTANITE